MPSHCIIVFDISTYIHRAFHSLPIEKFKRSHDNLATNAVYGTAKMLINTLQTIKWDYINIYPIICFDTSKSKLFRTAIDSDYKSNRPSAPSQLKHQFQWIRTLIHSMKLTNIEMPSCEADDLIASIVNKYKDNNDTDIIIVSNDKDMNQLVIQDNIKIYNPANKSYIKSNDIFDRYKVIPAHFTLYQALVGDRIDNIKGIKGIGPKTAQRLIVELKDKFTFDNHETIPTDNSFSKNQQDAYNALLTLGYKSVDIQNKIQSLINKNPNATTEELIKNCLKDLK